MRCPNCNSKNKKGSLFCNRCGEKIQIDNSEGLIKGKDFPLKRKTGMGVFLITLCILGLATLIYFVQNPVNKFETSLKDKNLNKALSIYSNEIEGDLKKEKKIKEILLNEIEAAERNFVDLKWNYTETIEKLKMIQDTELVDQEVSDAISNIEKLNNSRIAFKKAEEFLKDDNYIDAINELKEVVEQDKNYKDAQKMITDISDGYKNEVLDVAETYAKNGDLNQSILLLKEAKSILHKDNDIVAKLSVYEKKLEEIEKENAMSNQLIIVEESKIIEQDPTNKFLYPDMLVAIIRNNSDMTVKSFTIGFLGYDQNGYPVKIRGAFDFYGGSYEFIGEGDNVNIIPGATFGDGVGWELDEPHGLSTVIACVKSVTFYDGSTWKNPYYKYWIQEFKEKPQN